MDVPPAPVVLVVIAGPQASGKSAVARALADALRGQGESVALVELDAIAGMALPTLPDWAVAHAIFESVTGRWVRSGVERVVAEGSGTSEEVARLRAQATESTVVLTVALTAPFSVALARAQADPTRGISRDRDFLAGAYERWPTELARIDADLLIDTGEVSLEGCVDRVRSAMLGATERRTR